MVTYHHASVKMMRILHVVHQYPPEHTGGTEFYTAWLTQALQQRGHQVAVFHRASGQGSGVTQKAEGGVTIFSAWDGAMTPNGRFRSTFHNKSLSASFAQVLAETKPQLVHLQHLMGLPTKIAHQIQHANLPYMVTLHDYWYGCANAQLITNFDNTLCGGPKGWLNCARCAQARANQPEIALARPFIVPLFALRQSLLRRVLANAAVIIAPSNFVRQQYADLGLPTGQLQVVRHGIALPTVEEQRLMTNRQPFTKPPLRITYIGGLAWQKGVHLLVTAVNQLPPEATQLTIYGDPDAFPDYVAHLKQLANPQNIRFGGKLARQKLWQALANSDVLVVPSIWYETSSLIIQEAQAAGIPVVASDIGAIPEKVIHNVDGILVTPNSSQTLFEALNALLQNPEKLSELSGNIKPVRNMAQHVAEIEEIYETAVKQK